jgi:hypothetical protein
MSNLTEQIKELRIRTVQELPTVQRLASKARAALIAKKPQKVTVAHTSGEYFFYATKRAPIRYSRPIKSGIYINEEKELKSAFQECFTGEWNPKLAPLLLKVVYTLTQDVASYLDFFSPQAAKKAIGTFFEGIVAATIHRFTNQIVGSGRILVPAENLAVSVDLAVWLDGNVKLYIATKTSTRERLSQPFVQKLIISKTQTISSKSILIVIGDVQRVEENRIQHTFTAGQFRLYSLFVDRMDGVYYLDVPPQAESLVQDGLLKPFEQLPTDLQFLLA